MTTGWQNQQWAPPIELTLELGRFRCYNRAGGRDSRMTKGHWNMDTKKFIYYQEEDMFVGWLDEYPDYRTQGESLEQLKENLIDLHRELTSGHIPCVRRVGELDVA